jgi:hypothetical protein
MGVGLLCPCKVDSAVLSAEIMGNKKRLCPLRAGFGP